MIPRKASIKKRQHYKDQIKLSFLDANPRYFTPVCAEEEIPGVISHINHLITLGKFSPEDFIPGLQADAMTMVQLSEEYLQYRKKAVEREQIAPGTYQNDYEALKIFSRFIGKDRSIKSILRDDIDSFVDHLRTTKSKIDRIHSWGGIGVKIRHLKTAFNYAVQNEWIIRNHFLKYKMPEEAKIKEEFRYLYEEEIENLRTYFANQSAHQLDIFNFAMNTGLRASGIIRAQFRWIREGEGVQYLRIMEKRQRNRDIPLNKLALDIIDRRRRWIESGEYKNIIKKNIPAKYQDSSSKRAQEGYIFFEISSVSGITHFFMKAKKRLKKKGLIEDDVTFHSTRHTFATKSLESGKSIEWVREVMGHSDIRTTQIYAKITRKHLKREFKEEIVF